MDGCYWGWLYPRPNSEKPRLGVVMVNFIEYETDDFYKKYRNYKMKTNDSRQFGKIEVLIVKDDEK